MSLSAVTRSWGIRPRLLLGFLGALAPILVVVPSLVAEYHFLGQHLLSVPDREIAYLAHADAAEEAIIGVEVPVQQYYVTASPSQRDLFPQRLARAREVLLWLEINGSRDPEDQEILGKVLALVARAEALGNAIMTPADPRSDPIALERLGGFHELIVEALAQLRELARIERQKADIAMAGARRLLERGRAASTLATEACVLVGVALAIAFSHWMSRPILAIGRGSRRLAEGDLRHRLAVTAGGELGEAARAFNAMAERLQASTQAVRESEARYRLLAENLSDVIEVYDMDLSLTYVSPSVRQLRGFTPEEAMGQPMKERLTPASCEVAGRTFAEELAKEQAGGADPSRSRAVELEMYRKDGSTVWAEMRLRSLRDEAGSPIGIVAVSRDITERKRLEQLKSDFVALTTHQLRTPLGGIRWLLELAGEAPELTHETRACLQGAWEATDRLRGIVDSLLDIAQLESATLKLEPEVTDLGKLTRSVLDEMGPGLALKRLRVSVAGSESVAPLPADARWLRQAILNLVSNAVKYTHPGGEIAIRMSASENSARWEIRDDGIGIPPEAHAHLFEKFYRAPNAASIAPEGTGLGLYLTRLIVERLGGRIWFESEVGHGATFRFTLPVG